jgi:DNA polymerase-4
VVVPEGGEAAFLAPLAIGRLWGVGKVMAEALSGLGITTIGQLQKMPRAVLVRRFGGHGADLHDLAFGRDDRAVEPYTAAKSMGAEETFEADCRDPARLATVLREQAERVARELRDSNVAAARLTLKLRFSDFHTITRAVTADPTQDGLELYRRARLLLDREYLDQPVRLIGISASALGPAGAGQLPLLDPAMIRREKLAKAVTGSRSATATRSSSRRRCCVRPTC